MKITNAQYELMIRSLKGHSASLRWATDSLDLNERKETDTLIDKLMKEYQAIAMRNRKSNMTSREEELYPSRLNDEYGGVPNESSKME